MRRGYSIHCSKVMRRLTFGPSGWRFCLGHTRCPRLVLRSPLIVNSGTLIVPIRPPIITTSWAWPHICVLYAYHIWYWSIRRMKVSHVKRNRCQDIVCGTEYMYTHANCRWNAKQWKKKEETGLVKLKYLNGDDRWNEIYTCIEIHNLKCVCLHITVMRTYYSQYFIPSIGGNFKLTWVDWN